MGRNIPIQPRTERVVSSVQELLFDVESNLTDSKAKELSPCPYPPPFSPTLLPRNCLGNFSAFPRGKSPMRTRLIPNTPSPDPNPSSEEVRGFAQLDTGAKVYTCMRIRDRMWERS